MNTHTYEHTPMYIHTHILLYKIYSKTLALTLWRWTSSKTFRMTWQWNISSPCFDLDLKAETCRTWGEPQPGSCQAKVSVSV